MRCSVTLRLLVVDLLEVDDDLGVRRDRELMKILTLLCTCPNGRRGPANRASRAFEATGSQRPELS